MTNLDSILKSKDIKSKINIRKSTVPPYTSSIPLKNRNDYTLFFWAPKSLQMVTAAMKLKTYSLEEKL